MASLLGFAHKQGQNRRSWRRRYFVISPLSSTSSMLSYFTTEGEARIGAPTSRKGCMVLGKGTRVLEEHECRVNWPSSTFVSGSGLGIQTQHRTLYLHCKSPLEAKDWKNLLRARIQQHTDVVAEKNRRASQLSTSQLSEFSDDGDDEGGSHDTRLKTVVLRKKKHGDLAVLCKQLAVRNATLNDQVYELEGQVQRTEEENSCLHRFSAYLRTVLLQHGVGLESLLPFDAFVKDPSLYSTSGDDDEQWGFDSEDDDDNDTTTANSTTTTITSSSATASTLAGGSGRDEELRRRDVAAAVIQRWYRGCVVNRHFTKVKATANERGRRRTLDRQRLNAKVHPRHGDIHARPRLPTTSLASRELWEEAVGGSNSGSTAASPHLRSVGHPSVSSMGAGLSTGGVRRTASMARRPSYGGRRLTAAMMRRLPRQEERHEEADEDAAVAAAKKQKQQQMQADEAKPSATTTTKTTKTTKTATAAGARGSGASGANKAARKSVEISFSPPAEDASTTTAAPTAGNGSMADQEYFHIGGADEHAASATTAVDVDADTAAGTSSKTATIKSLSAVSEPVSADAEATELELARLAMYRFNKNPSKGIHDLMMCGLVVDDPQEIMSFLCQEPGISRAKLGEFLGSDEDRSKACLQAYANTFDFTNAAIDVCLRLFLLAFRIPGEAQKIERVMAAFAHRYHSCNPTCFCHEDTAFILAFSIMMLHTDLHNPSNVRKMTLNEFVRNNRGIDDGGDVPRDVLEGIYSRIQAEEFQCCVDHTNKVEDLEQRLTGHVPASIVTETRQFVRTADASELYRSKKDSAKKGAAVKRVITLLIFNDMVLVASQARSSRRYHIRKAFDLFTSSLHRETEHGPETYILHNKESGSSIRFAPDDHSVISAIHDATRLCARVKTFSWADSSC
ncbi:cytohesin 2 [Salpingoeca rosetta]|uniref:Cytohesin 2 n=1 Tax=Salpingoeca rosetta (strain ATCC 50818 / BSB-021) TaxID=946362 RepID=F2UF98_SALR5|nr:cytohesin 2 [Salpingoeca rosetta]EGD75298.1 cytohesin 2 [Salpingoeca rosetta]|eukprot:XP_004992351.1 cytohesin 2 [Salpingoeca rosetta]